MNIPSLRTSIVTPTTSIMTILRMNWSTQPKHIVIGTSIGR
jgi:hypothetical protein